MENTKEKGLLLTWKPEVSVWDYEKVYSDIQNGKKAKTTGWRTRALQEVKIGMEVFIMKLGEEPKGIIAHGHVLKGPYLENETYYVDVEFDSIQNADDEKNIISLTELKNKFKSKTWDSQGDAVGSYIDETILPELKEMWSKLINGKENSETSDGGDEKETMKKEFDKNVIFYGPPGTGKTYTTAKRAVAICDKIAEEDLTDYTEVMKRYNELKENNRIEFITFHQSYGYEEFIEGIKPKVLNEDDEAENESENNQESKTDIKIENDVKYKIEAGIFKKFCDNAKKAIIESESNIYISPKAIVWKVTVRDEVKEDCFTNNHVRINFKLDTAGATKFNNEIKKGDIIITTNGSRTKINGIAVVTDGKAYTLNKAKSDTTTRNVSWLVKGIDEDIYEINDKKILPRKTVTKVPNMKVEDIIKLAKEKEPTALSKEELSKIVIKENTEPYVFIIDEINRGNISKIFGELITLIETTKRSGEGKKECISTKLPYSKEEFTVPDNVYIIGTMNTADRSIALMDTALRRRFKFEEMLPDYDLLKDIFVEDEGVKVNIGAMLKAINERIEYLYDREHTIGHAVFLEKGKDDKIDIDINKLENIFKKNIIPLKKLELF
ncbi:AAA family ATPase [Fusobacterium pseudoperiodonticum]|uniref:AAA family ATPase n=1 Tax=Fusobacterium pseudoperiodonticum TaxID=2663009 RepID=UPI0030D290A3